MILSGQWIAYEQLGQFHQRPIRRSAKFVLQAQADEQQAPRYPSRTDLPPN